MIRSFSILLCVLITGTLNAQYYYKDILSSQQTGEQIKKYKESRIKNVRVESFESTGEKTEDFDGQQQISSDYSRITTTFNTALAGTSQLTTFFNASGQLIRTVDTTDGSGSVSEYTYDQQGRLASIVNTSTSPGAHKEKEEHRWFYNSNNKPERMLRIKNNTDTTHISFVLDENGNVAEENSRRNGTTQTSYYYYYNNNKLTDIVTYNRKAQRLLPIYVFEYNNDGTVSSMLVVPEGSDDYQRWRYEYSNGLKTKETCYNKRRQLLGRIEYVYER